MPANTFEPRSIIVSCLRTQALSTIDVDDITYTGTLSYVWLTIGPGMDFMVASSMVLRPLFDKLHIPRYKKSFSRMTDEAGELGKINRARPGHTARGFAVKDGRMASSHDVSSISALSVAFAPGGLRDGSKDGIIRVETDWQVFEEVQRI